MATPRRARGAALVEEGQFVRGRDLVNGPQLNERPLAERVLTSALRRGFVPQEYRFEIMVAWKEALSNAEKYHIQALLGESGGVVGYRIAATCDRVELFLWYGTLPFDDNPPAPPPDEELELLIKQQGVDAILFDPSLTLSAERGRGILLMRELSSDISFHQTPDGLVLCMGFEWECPQNDPQERAA